MFKEGKRLDYCDQNPAKDTRVPAAAGPDDTYAYSFSEIIDIMNRLPEPAATMFAIAAYAGLRRGEIEGLKWENYHDGELPIRANRSGMAFMLHAEASGRT